MELPMSEHFYYIETDGMLYLVEQGDRWVLPSSPQEIPFAFEPREVMIIAGREVLYCVPQLDRHPHNWHHKDEIPGRENVDPFVRQAVHQTLPRVVAEGVIRTGDRLLLVKPLRGFNAGQWTLPGGFVSYGESPAQAVQREVEEEVGARCRVGKLLDVHSFLGKRSFYTWHMFSYDVALLSEDFHPAPDEIEEVRWFSLAEALQALQAPKRALIEKILTSTSEPSA
jgi:ADP-ribose pyrophosphatase YjhB (NUDIX family)